MNPISRKLQKINKSFFVSLPKSWVKNLGLDKNSLIEMVICDDGSITLLPKLNQPPLENENEIVLSSSRYVARDIVKHCLSGIDRIIIASNEDFDEEIWNDLPWFVTHLPNAEIIEKSNRRVVIHNFGYKTIPTKKVIQRLLYLTCEMFENLRTNSKEELLENFESIRRFYFILITHIRTYLRTGVYISEDKTFTPLQAMDYRMFCEKIERIALILRNFDYKKDELNGFFQKVEFYFTDVMDAFLRKNHEKACKAWFNRDQLVQEADKIKKNLECDAKDKLRDLLRIVEYCKDMADLI